MDFAADFTPPERRGNIGSTLSAMLRNAMASLALGGALLGAAGCGDVFRPPVSSISPVGPAAQPARYAVATSDPGNGQPGLFNMIDFSGDTVLNTTTIGVSPQYMILSLGGTLVLNLNHGGSVNSFGVSSTLLANQVQTSTLFAGADATSIFPSTNFMYFTEPYTGCTTPGCGPSVAEAVGSPPAVQQELSVAPNPIFIAGTSTSSRIYAISQGATPGTGSGTVTAIQVATNSLSNTFSVGTNPVYGIMTTDNNRAFVLNEGSNNVSVINVNTNQLDASPNPNPIPVGGGPVWADLYAPGNLLVTANSTGNSVSIITIPLCSIEAQPANPNCDASNPTDASTFGTVLATVPVGNDPQAVTVLQDGTRAYVANFNATNVSQYSIVGDSAAITGFSINSNVATITANNDYLAGSYVSISGVTNNGTVLNGGPYTVLASGLSPTQFQIAVTSPNVTASAVSGTATEGTATVTAPNSYTSGESVMLGGLRNGAGPSINGGPYKVLPAGLSTSQFEVEVPFGTTAPTADYGTTSVAGTYGSVSVVNLSNYTVTTIPFDGLLNSDGSENINHGPNCHPNFINSIAGTPTGKVYVTCPDGTLMTVIETDTDTLTTLINLQGYAVQMRVTQQE